MQRNKLKYATRAVFNVANLNAAGAVSLSVGLGSPMGAVVFAAGAAVGSYNKYKSVFRSASEPEPMLCVPEDGDPYRARPSPVKAALPSSPPPPRLVSRLREWALRQWRDPAITAKILMGAALWNAVQAGIDAVMKPPGERAYHIARGAGWLLGFIGDNVLRRMDGVNFGDVLERQDIAGISLLRKSFMIAAENPSVYYNLGVTSMSVAMLASGRAGIMEQALAGGVGLVCLGGSVHALRRGWQAAKGCVAPDAINDGVVNGALAGGSLLQGTFAAVSGNWWVTVAQVPFTIGAFRQTCETREALKKQGLVPGK